MSDTHRTFLVVGLCLALSLLEPVRVPVASAYVGDCHVGTLATPDEYGKYSADYFLPRAALTGQPYNFTLAVYGPDHVPEGQIPTTENTVVLNSQYQPVIDRTGNPLTWDAAPDGCEQEGTHSHMYRFAGHWAGAPLAGPYILAVRFRFPSGETGNGVTVDFFVNLQVFDASPPTFSLTHWETRLDGLPDQNPTNNAYNLDTASEQARASTIFYFKGNPNVDGTSFVDGGMVSSIADASSDSPFVVGGNIPVSQRSFPYVQAQGGGPQTGTLSTQHVVQTVGGQSYSWEVRVAEPLQVHTGRDYHLKVGSYVIDNGFTGNVLGDGSATNIGEGRGFTFYADPGIPTVPSDADPNNATISWTPVNPATWDPATTRLSYSLTLCPPNATTRTDCILQQKLTAPSYTASLSPGVPYDASLTALFSQGPPNDPVIIESDTRHTTLEVDGPRLAPTATPTPPPASPTATATAVPPTATPLPTATPTVGPADGTLSSVATPYAWISGALLPAGTPDPLLPTTRNNRDSAHFDWPAGVELRVLPALSEHSDEAKLYLHDPNGATALAYPDTVESITYTVTGGPCGTGTLSAGGSYPHDEHRYLGEVAPIAGATALPGAFNLVWLTGPTPTAGTHDAAICSVDDYLRHASGRALPPDLPITYTVVQRLHFTLVFHDTARGMAATPAVCPLLPAYPEAAATPGPAFSGDPAPLRGTTAGACDAGDVRLLTVQKALAAGRIAHDGSLDSSTVWGSPRARPNGDGTTTLDVAFQMTRSLSLGYHLVMLHEVAP